MLSILAMNKSQCCTAGWKIKQLVKNYYTDCDPVPQECFIILKSDAIWVELNNKIKPWLG